MVASFRDSRIALLEGMMIAGGGNYNGEDIAVSATHDVSI
jgi:hypothetical protein